MLNTLKEILRAVLPRSSLRNLMGGYFNKCVTEGNKKVKEDVEFFWNEFLDDIRNAAIKYGENKDAAILRQMAAIKRRLID